MREQIGHDAKPYGIDVIDVRIRPLRVCACVRRAMS
jgi:hypothetical protein